MDKQVVALLIPIAALAIPVVAIIMNGLQKVWRLRVEDARLRSGGGETVGAEELQALRGQMELMQRQLSELNERVDFTERLLTRGRTSGEGSGPSP
jgi:DNA-binding protein YbaB